MQLRKVQFFLRIARNGSLSKAAEGLYLTQPTLSRFLAKLEDEAGTKLFLRQKDNSLKLTEAGEVYLKAAQKIEAIWDSMESELNELKAKNVRRIRLGIDGDVMHPFAQACADTICEKYPNTSVEIYAFSSPDIQNKIQNGELDIGLASYSKLDDALSYRIFTKNEVDLAVCKSHPLAKYSYQIPGQEKLRISLKSLDPNTPFLLAREGFALRDLVDDYMKQINFTPYVPSTFLQPMFLADILNAKKSLVGFTPRHQIHGSLAYIAIDPPLFLIRGVCYSKGRELSSAENALIALLQGAQKQVNWDDIYGGQSPSGH